mgnify:CR=1 FL=1
MQTMQIVLFTIDDVKRFVTLTNKYKFAIDLSNGKYKIDAKSIMGVFSLGTSQPITLEIDSDPSEEKEVEEFMQAVQEFAAK